MKGAFMKCECGSPNPCEYHDITPEMKLALSTLKSLTEIQRGRILCWFCSGCYRYVGPGDYCHCENDE